MLNAYNDFTSQQGNIRDVIKIEHQQLFDDFMHIKLLHIDAIINTYIIINNRI